MVKVNMERMGCQSYSLIVFVFRILLNSFKRKNSLLQAENFFICFAVQDSKKLTLDKLLI